MIKIQLKVSFTLKVTPFYFLLGPLHAIFRGSTSTGELRFPQGQPSTPTAEVGAQPAVRWACSHLASMAFELAPEDEGRQEGMAVLGQLNKLSACLEGIKPQRLLGN